MMTTQETANLKFRAEHPNYYKEYRAKHQKEDRERLRTWRKNHLEITRAQKLKWRENNPEKALAHKLTWRLKNPQGDSEVSKRQRKIHPEKVSCRKRSLVYPLGEKCNNCGSTEHLQRHHTDYSKPDVFFTLCRKCHGRLSRVEGRRIKA